MKTPYLWGKRRRNIRNTKCNRWEKPGVPEVYKRPELTKKNKKDMNSFYKVTFRGCGKMQFQAMYKEKLDGEKEA